MLKINFYCFKRLKIKFSCKKVKSIFKVDVKHIILSWRSNFKRILGITQQLELLKRLPIHATSAALSPTELSSQLGAGHLWVRYLPVDGEDIIWIYEKYILSEWRSVAIMSSQHKNRQKWPYFIIILYLSRHLQDHDEQYLIIKGIKWASQKKINCTIFFHNIAAKKS